MKIFAKCFLLLAVTLVSAFTFAACDPFADTRNSDNEHTDDLGGTQSSNGELMPMQPTDYSYGVFTPDIFSPVKDYTEYLDFTIEEDWTFDYSNEENEEIFAKILSGEFDYRDYLGWFALNPQYIIRYNLTELQVIETVIESGDFNEEMRAQYAGLLTWGGAVNNLKPYIQVGMPPFYGVGGYTLGNPEYTHDRTSYRIDFNDDWTIMSFEKIISFVDSEIKQLRYLFEPTHDDGVIDYYLHFASLLIYVDMGDGKTAACSADVIYNKNIEAQEWGRGRKYKTFNVLSNVRITIDFNNVYTEGRNDLFEETFLITDKAGDWDLINVWNEYRELALTRHEKVNTISNPTIIIF